MTGSVEVVIVGLISAGAVAIPLLLTRNNRNASENGVAWAASLVIALFLVQIVLIIWAVPSRAPPDLTSPDALVNFGFAVLIGLLVGATELMSRYRDEPFAPLLSVPGVFYVMINGGASALAYYLLRVLAPTMDEPLRTFTAGIAAMTFFRSSLFTVRLGSADVPVGPNLILLTVLKSLDRAYDRTRAEPRSKVIREIMGNLAFEQVKSSLPALCFDLMQNLSTDEITSINTQITQLSQNASMSNSSKCLSLGLALLNLVGERTLRAAVATLGSDAQAFRQVDNALLIKLAALPPDIVASTLPEICRELYSSTNDSSGKSPPEFAPKAGLSTDSQVVLLVYRPVNFYGGELVSVASNLVKSGSVPGPLSQPSPPPPSPPPPSQSAPSPAGTTPEGKG